MLMQQVLGRLVRGPGLKRNRRIFVLDGRLGDQSMKGHLRPAMEAISQYPIESLTPAFLTGSGLNIDPRTAPATEVT